MEEAKQAAYYEDMKSRGSGASRTKQGLGFSGYSPFLLFLEPGQPFDAVKSIRRVQASTNGQMECIQVILILTASGWHECNSLSSAMSENLHALKSGIHRSKSSIAES